MKLYSDLSELPTDFRAGAVTIGNFDGVHRGHAELLAQLTKRAGEFAHPSVVFTFEPHPVRLLRPTEAPAPLTWVKRKAELLSQQNVDVLIAFPTSLEFLSLSPEAYFQQVIRDHLKTQAIVEGPNFFFGKNREGDTHTLKTLCDQSDITLDIVTPVTRDDDFVSSSRVREALRSGDVDQANAMLTQPYRIRGLVTHGAGRGSTIGFPTANLSGIDTLLPGTGVYAGRAWIDETAIQAAINIGPNPTFGEDSLKVEVHLLDFDRSIYGEVLEVDFLTRIRDVQQFASLEALKAQLSRDIACARDA